MLDQHGHLADERARSDGLGSACRTRERHAICRPRHDQIGAIARLPGSGDDIAAPEFDSLRVSRNLGDLQRPQPGEERDAQQRRNQFVDSRHR